MCADYGPVGDRRRLVDVYPQLSEDLSPAVFLCPVAKAIVDGLPFAEPLRQIAPLDAGLRSKDDGVEEDPVAARSLATSSAIGKQRLKPSPLLVGQRVPLHIQL